MRKDCNRMGAYWSWKGCVRRENKSRRKRGVDEGPLPSPRALFPRWAPQAAGLLACTPVPIFT